jgi:hypothetical protein
MNSMPSRSDLSQAEYSSLCLVAKGFMSWTIPSAHRTRLVQLGLIQDRMGGLMPTPAGTIVARMVASRFDPLGAPD